MAGAGDFLSLIPVEQIANQVVPQLVTDIRLRTDFTDEQVLVNSGDIVKLVSGRPTPPGKASKILSMIKPTVIMRSPTFGERVWAPWGASDPRTPSVWKGRVQLLLGATVLGLVAVGFGLGRLSKK